MADLLKVQLKAWAKCKVLIPVKYIFVKFVLDR